MKFQITFWNVHLTVTRFPISLSPVGRLAAYISSWTTTKACCAKNLKLMRYIFSGTLVTSPLRFSNWWPHTNKHKSKCGKQNKTSPRTPNDPSIRHMIRMTCSLIYCRRYTPSSKAYIFLRKILRFYGSILRFRSYPPLRSYLRSRFWLPCLHASDIQLQTDLYLD